MVGATMLQRAPMCALHAGAGHAARGAEWARWRAARALAANDAAAKWGDASNGGDNTDVIEPPSLLTSTSLANGLEQNAYNK